MIKINFIHILPLIFFTFFIFSRKLKKTIKFKIQQINQQITDIRKCSLSPMMFDNKKLISDGES